MSNNAITQIETKFLSIIKGRFIDYIDINGDFDLCADSQTESTLNDMFEWLGISVNGMSITPSEFSVTFDFDQTYTPTSPHTAFPMHLRLCFENDGEYSVTLGEEQINEALSCSITDRTFNHKLPASEIETVMHHFDTNLTLKVLQR
jgi:hypothetical protein